MPTVEDSNSLFNEINIANTLDEDELVKLGKDLIEQIEADDDSRSAWMENMDDMLELAAQVAEEKSSPWPNASNVKYPLLTTTAVQFHARAYPNIINSRNPVLAKIEGKKTQDKIARANRVSEYMSYQVMEQMDEWQEDMDRLLFILPIVGLMWKKVFYSPSLQRPTSMLASPRDVIVNYDAVSYDRARITHRLYMDSNEIYEHQAANIFRDIDLSPSAESQEGFDTTRDNTHGLEKANVDDPMGVRPIYECHTFLDLDEDGYKEPYVVTLSEDGVVLRIVARYYESGVERDTDGSIIKIKPIQHFVPYKFLPDLESSIYAIGFGKLLGPGNEAINTLLNQLIDAGTLSIRQGGFIGRGARIRGGSIRFSPGKWVQVQSTGDDLRKNIFPLPVKEPSAVLFQLLGMLIESSQTLSSVQDMMTGKNPGQNQPYATSVQVLEQGLKVFNGIYKRIYRSLTREFKALFDLNMAFPDNEKYQQFHDEQMVQMELDFTREGYDICPSAEPDMVSEAQKIMKAQALAQHMAEGLVLNRQEVTRRVLEVEGHEGIEELMKVPPPQPDFETQLEMQRFEHQKQMDMAEQAISRIKAMAEARKDLMQSFQMAAKTEDMKDARTIEAVRLMNDIANSEAEQAIKELGAITQAASALRKTSVEEEQSARETNSTAEASSKPAE